VDLQLAALRSNDTPEPDAGIATVHAFFPKEIGDYFLFAERYRDGLRSLVRPADTYTLAVVHDDGARASVRASLVPDPATPPNAQRADAPAPILAVIFHLARAQTAAGPCWLNTGLHFCDSS
jgi:hypothetical protein